MENVNDTETGSGNGQKIPDTGYNVIIQIKFHSMMLLGNVVGPFHTVPQNSLIEQSLCI